MKVGEKIRTLRTLKGLSQENMAHALGLSLTAYGDIERDQKSVNLDRLEKIAEVLQVSVTDILTFGEKIANFFDQCGVANGINGVVYNNPDTKEVQHELEKARLEIEKLKMEIAKLEAEKAKAELEAAYWREKVGV